MCKSVIISLAILAVASTAMAQAPASCSQATGLSFNNTAFVGTWFEVARNPASDVACILLSVDLWNNTNLLVNVSHSNSNTSLYMDINEKANITLVTGQTGYNVSLVAGSQTDYVYVKLLQYVSDTYLVGCTYTDGTNASTSAGFILARPNYTEVGIQGINNNASLLFSNFQNNTYGNVTQMGCYASSAGQALPWVTLFLTLALLLIKA